MACPKRINCGSCPHHQCQFSDLTPHGYECVDILATESGQYCEVGENCIKECPFSYVPTKKIEAEIMSLFNEEEI